MENYNYTTIGAVLAIIILLAGVFGPWYTLSVESSLFGNGSINIGLLETTFSGENDLIDFAGSVSIDRGGTDNALYIALITIVLAVVTLLGILGTMLGFGEKETMQKIGEICGFLTFITAIVTIIYYITNTPEVPDLSMVGVNSGLGWGFYLFFVGAIILIATNFWSRFTRSE